MEGIIIKTLSIEDYIITRDGKIINKKRGNVLKAQLNGKGYLRVSIGKKLKFVHRLVAEKYIPNPNNLPQVNHKDGNKLNNCIDNLEWVSNEDNRKHALKNGLHLYGEKCSWSKLKEKDVIYILDNYPKMTIKELSIKFNVNRNTISDIVHHRTWKQLKRYAELSRNEVIELEDKKPLG